MITVHGLSFEKVLSEVNKEGLRIVKAPIRATGELAKSRAQDISPVVSGTFRKSIILTTANKDNGDVSVTVGVNNSSPAIKYAWKVENKYNIFNTLDKEMRIPLTTILTDAIKASMNTLRID